MDHQIYSKKNNMWIKQRPENHPQMDLEVTVCGSTYEQLDIPLTRITSKQVRAATMPDTGAQKVVAKKELVPVSTKVSGANNLDLRILGGSSWS